MAKFKLMMARFPGGGVERHESSSYFMNLLWKELRQTPEVDYDGLVPWKKADTPIDMVRNACAYDATFVHNCDYLLMIDSDMDPDQPLPGAKPFWQTAWDWMMQHRDQPGLVAAPYCGPPPFENIYVFTWAKRQSDAPEGGYCYCLDQYSREQAAEFGSVTEVAALPTGLMLIDCRVFRGMAEQKMLPWFAYEWTDPFRREKASTEDVYFTRNASLMGFPCWCAWDSWARHIKTKHVGKPQLFSPDDVRDVRALAARRIAQGDTRIILDPAVFERMAAKEERLQKARAVLGARLGRTFQEEEFDRAREKAQKGGGP